MWIQLVLAKKKPESGTADTTQGAGQRSVVKALLSASLLAELARMTLAGSPQLLSTFWSRGMH